jgi:hypothetical protein
VWDLAARFEKRADRWTKEIVEHEQRGDVAPVADVIRACFAELEDDLHESRLAAMSSEPKRPGTRSIFELVNSIEARKHS